MSLLLKKTSIQYKHSYSSLNCLLPKRGFSIAFQEPLIRERSLIADYNNKELLLIGDTQKVKRKLRHFQKKGGLDNLCVLTDFDFTLTRYSLDGYNKLDASFACIRKVIYFYDYSQSQYANDQFRQLTSQLFNYYHPFEKNIEISDKEKHQKLLEWWTQDLNLISQLKLHKDHFRDMLETSNMHFRHGIDHLLRSCSYLKVPLVIVSAAIHDVVETAVDKIINEIQPRHGEPIERDIVHVIANQSYKHPETQQVNLSIFQSLQIISFQEPIVHTCNKDEVVLDYFKNSRDKNETDLLKRHNIIVMGDLIDDIKMAKYLHQTEDDILSVGFFNNPAKDGEKLLREYEKHFDMVVMNDGNLHFLHYFLSRFGFHDGKIKSMPKQNPFNEISYEDLKEHELGKHYVGKKHKINELFENFVNSQNYPNCLDFANNGGVTTLVSDSSTDTIFIQTIEIQSGSTCIVQQDGKTKIVYSSPIIAKYTRYTGSNCDPSSQMNCPVDKWYGGVTFVKTCYVETLINNGPSQSSQFTIYLSEAFQKSVGLILIGLIMSMVPLF